LAIELTDLHEIVCVLKDRPKIERGRLLFLGSAEVHITKEIFRELLLKHGIDADVPDEKITPFSLGESLGFHITETLDINGQASITHDLMQPVPENLLERYDMIIDAGVLFWCFNPGVALGNILSMLRVGGDVVHITAVSGFYGRGYYNIHPKLLDDFYSANQCNLISATFRSRRRPETLLRSLFKRLRATRFGRSENLFHGRSKTFGHVFLRQDGWFSYTFSPEAPAEFLYFIPNDVIGVLAYRKLRYATAVSPVLL